MSSPLAELELELETEANHVILLERNRGWLSLRGHIQGRRAAKERILFAALFTRAEPVDQREIDYLRGYFDAMDWMTGLPTRMQKKLKEE